MFFQRNKNMSIDTSEIEEPNVFVVKNAFKSVMYYIVSGKCVRGNFNINDRIIVREQNCDILEGYIDKIKTYDHVDIEMVNSDFKNSISLYILIQNNEENQKITNKDIIVNHSLSN